MERKIAIVINYVDTPRNANVVRALGLGIEEEGLPFITQKLERQALYDLALMASNTSDLDVGVAVDASGNVGIHQAKLPDGMVLFEARADQINCRSYGANAARLIKGVPFKEYLGREENA
ncbi:MAG: hypothetical protein PWP51_1224 [Clostridiales bacterium]|jgi:hypothetical protein|nr:hypothetical protein [Clostridiales bacterium]